MLGKNRQRTAIGPPVAVHFPFAPSGSFCATATMSDSSRDRFFTVLRTAVQDRTLVKLTLGKYRGADSTLRNVFIRAVSLKSGPHLSFVWRHITRDITKNLVPEAALTELETLIGRDFLDAHLFTITGSAQLETQADGSARLRIKQSQPTVVATDVALNRNDQPKQYAVDVHASWLRALGVTNDRGQPREGMSDKYRQIQKFAELLSHLIAEAELRGDTTSASIEVADMGSGKGYLTFAVASLLGTGAHVLGVEVRPDLVELCNRIAGEHGFAPGLAFSAGTIATTPLERCDLLIALHACDTATDDALARGIAAGARLLVVAPCCQKELRRQLTAAPVLADALRHGIFQERQAEFATDALRAQLLEWAGFRTKVFEFVSTEHTAKNVMIAAIRERPVGTADDDRAQRIRAFAAFYGIRTQALARHLDFELAPENAGSVK